MKLLSVVLAGVLTTLPPAEPDPSDGYQLSSTLKVITRQAPNTYYVGENGEPQGLEYKLAQRFADELGMTLEIDTATSPVVMMSALERGRAHIAAPGISLAAQSSHGIRMGPGYQRVKQLLVFRRGAAPPESTADLYGNVIDVLGGTSHLAALERLKVENPWIQWRVNPYGDSVSLLKRVWRDEVTFAIADSHEVSRMRRILPELRTAFELGEPQALAWAFSPHTDGAIYAAALRFFERMHRTGELDKLIEQYYGPGEKFDYVETRLLLRHIESRLPLYQGYFEAAAKRHDLDWRLLAAIGYQESHWDLDAVSPTGVKGIMMLTKTTAKQLELTDRTDPAQSIAGGAKYFADIKYRLPKSVEEPDRTWMALAAYNIGMGHLEDARKLADKNGRDPGLWTDVREFVLKLKDPEWHEQTRHGFARGNEGVTYVANIRRYFDTMIELDAHANSRTKDLYAGF